MNREIMNIALQLKHEIDSAVSDGAILVAIYDALERMQIFAFAAGYDDAVDDHSNAAGVEAAADSYAAWLECYEEAKRATWNDETRSLRP